MRREHLVERVDHVADAQILDLLHRGEEVAPEPAHEFEPRHLVVGDAVELLFEIGGEVVFDIAREEAFEKGRDDAAAVLRDQPVLLSADITAVLQHLQDRGIGRGPADAELLQPLDQGGFRIARRRLGEMLARIDPELLERLADAHLRQPALLLVLGRFVPALLIHGEKAVERDHGPVGAQIEQARPGRVNLRGDVDGGALELGRFHLARQGALENEFVQLGLVGIEEARDIARPPRDVGRPDRFVRLLRVLRLRLIAAGRVRHVARAVLGPDRRPDRRHGLFRDLHAVGAHIGDQADRLAADLDALVKALGDAHRMRGSKAELAARLLLQRRGGEGRRRVALGRLGFDRGDGKSRLFQRLLERLGLGAGADVEPCDLLPVGAHEPRLEALPARGRKRRHERPVFARDEFLDLELAVADEPQRDRLHPAGRTRARQLAPQHRREREADEIVERAAGEISIDQRLIDLARMLHRLGHRLLGDGVEDDPLDRLAAQGALLLQRFEKMPGDRFALAVRVGREDELVGGFERARDLVKSLLRPRIHLPNHAEIGGGIDRAVLRREVPHMAERGQHLIAAAEIFVDGLCLGRRFDDNYVHEVPCVFGNLCRRAAGGSPPRAPGKWVSIPRLSNCMAWKTG